MVLQNLKNTAESYLGDKVDKVLLQFLHISMMFERQATKDPVKLSV